MCFVWNRKFAIGKFDLNNVSLIITLIDESQVSESRYRPMMKLWGKYLTRPPPRPPRSLRPCLELHVFMTPSNLLKKSTFHPLFPPISDSNTCCLRRSSLICSYSTNHLVAFRSTLSLIFFETSALQFISWCHTLSNLEHPKNYLKFFSPLPCLLFCSKLNNEY